MGKQGKNIAIAGLLLVLALSAILPGATIWENIMGTLFAFIGGFALLWWNVSGASDPSNLETYVPLDIFDDVFGPSRLEITTRAILTGQAEPYYGSEYQKEISYVCLESFFVLVMLILVVVATYKLFNKQGIQEQVAHRSILIMWTFVAAAPLVCTITVQTWEAICTWATYIVMCTFSLISFAAIYFSASPSKNDKAQNENLIPEPSSLEQDTTYGHKADAEEDLEMQPPSANIPEDGATTIDTLKIVPGLSRELSADSEERPSLQLHTHTLPDEKASSPPPISRTVAAEVASNEEGKVHNQIFLAKHGRLLITILAVFLAVSLASAIVLAVKVTQTSKLLKNKTTLLTAVQKQNQTYHDRISTLREEKYALQSENTKLKEQARFFHDNIGLVVDGSKYYHCYTCTTFKEAGRYWAYNVKHCESMGYSRCPKCWTHKLLLY